jgi:hypothetical protein
MDSENRLRAVEQQLEQLSGVIGEMAEVKVQNQLVLQQLQRIVEATADRTIPETQGASRHTPADHHNLFRPRSRASILSNKSEEVGHPPKSSQLRPAIPNDFDGDRSKGRAFLTSCELYWRLAPTLFSDDVQLVNWTMSFMKTGRASKWAQRMLKQQFEGGESAFTVWDEFRTAFIAEFCPKNEAQMAVAMLETDGYHQGRKTIDQYVDEFRELVDQAGYKESLAIVVKFRKGLNRTIQDQIAQIPFGRPADDDAERWYELAIAAEENRTSNALFHGTLKSPTPTPRMATGHFTAPPRLGTAVGTTYRPPWPRPQAANNPRPGATQNPVPMEIDASRHKAPIPADVCRRCGKPGHWAKECPRQFDIRHMTVDERSELLQHLALQADTEDLETKEEEMEEAEETESPDFAKSGR